jgi:hypothetical protein
MSIIQYLSPLISSPNQLQGPENDPWWEIPPNNDDIPSQSPELPYIGHVSWFETYSMDNEPNKHHSIPKALNSLLRFYKGPNTYLWCVIPSTGAHVQLESKDLLQWSSMVV